MAVVVMAKCLEQRSRNLEAPSSNPPGVRAFSSSSSISRRVSLIRSLQSGASLLFFPISLGLNMLRMRILKNLEGCVTLYPVSRGV